MVSTVIANLFPRGTMSTTLTTHAPAAERRIAPRRQPAMGTICRLENGNGADDLGLVWNISTTGISMLLHDPRQTGTHLEGILETMDDGPSLPVGMSVVHVKLLETGDYFLGAHFDRPITDDEMKPFVK